MIVAGGGVMWSGAQRELVEIAEKLNIPVATSLNAKSAIADRHALAAGVIGAYSRSCANRLVSEADLVFFVGSHTGVQVTTGWNRGIEGMCIDARGNIIACGGWNKSGPGPLLYVFSPSGAVLETQPLPTELPMRVAFGDADLGGLYLTSGEGLLYRARDTGLRGKAAS